MAAFLASSIVNPPSLAFADEKPTQEANSNLHDAALESINYTIAYDANKPVSATTEMGGVVPSSVSAEYGNNYILGEGGSLSLPGYELVGWGVKPDGSGESYKDGETVSNLTSEDGATITLYAQWKRMTYQISFNAGEGATGSMSPISVAFDSAVELPLAAFDKDGYLFMGWQPGTSEGTLFDDGATVINQCLKDENGNFVLDEEGRLTGLALTAVWAKESDLDADACVVVTKDGNPVAGLSDKDNPRLVLKSVDGTDFAPFEETTIGGNAAYLVKNSSSQKPPQGVYSIWLDGVDTGQIIVIDGFSELCHVACSTVGVAFDQNIDSVQHVVVDGGSVLEDNVFVNGTRISYTAEISDPQSGYRFGNWESRGIAPYFVDGTSRISNPANIEVNGTLVLIAQAKQAECYFISFDANGATDGSDISGTMPDQKCFRDSKSTLSSNAYTRTGYVFEGWNTERDGSGTAYEDGAAVENLCSEDGGYVILYAQWEGISPQPDPTPDSDPDSDPDPDSDSDTPASDPDSDSGSDTPASSNKNANGGKSHDLSTLASTGDAAAGFGVALGILAAVSIAVSMAALLLRNRRTS